MRLRKKPARASAPLEEAPKRVVAAGTFPAWMIDQRLVWVDPKGYARRIPAMSEAEVLWAIDYILANADKLRSAWSKVSRSEYDVDERPRRWMLKRDITRALMRRLFELEKEQLPWE